MTTSTIKYWVWAIRPKTLPAGLAPVVLAAVLAWRDQKTLNVMLLSAIVFCAIFLQIMANLINDYFDSKSGVDDQDRIGPVRVTNRGLLDESVFKRGIYVVLGLVILIGSYLCWFAGLPILLIGILSICFALLYTAGPLPLSHYGLGELLALIFFGLVSVSGSYYILTLTWNWEIAFYAAGPGLIAATIMAVNNLRDHRSDRKHGKITLAVLSGEMLGRLLCLILIGLSVMLALTLLWKNDTSTGGMLLMGLSPLLFIKTWRNILLAPIDANFNKYLAQTGLYLLVYTLSFSIGILQ